jgi:hypothetical protein
MPGFQLWEHAQVSYSRLFGKQKTLAYGDTGEMGDGVYASLPWSLAILKNSLSQSGGYPTPTETIADTEENR